MDLFKVKDWSLNDMQYFLMKPTDEMLSRLAVWLGSTIYSYYVPMQWYLCMG